MNSEEDNNQNSHNENHENTEPEISKTKEESEKNNSEISNNLPPLPDEKQTTDEAHGKRHVRRKVTICRTVRVVKYHYVRKPKKQVSLSSIDLPQTYNPPLRNRSSTVNPIKRSANTEPCLQLTKSKSKSEFDLIELNHAIDEEDKRVEAIYQFNSNPKKNINKLCEYYKKPATPENIAELLHTVPGLLGEQIGNYLTTVDNQDILLAYLKRLDLHTDIVEAMRRALSSTLYLPGESQRIDQFVQTFSNCYFTVNPHTYSNPEIPYILSFALIMLNSDLHNPNVQHRMTCQQFINNIKNSYKIMNEVCDEDLTTMYDSLKRNPFHFSVKSNSFLAMSAPKNNGTLKLKTDKIFSKWKKYYFVLVNSSLYFFKDNSQESKDDPLGSIQLTEVEILESHRKNVEFIIRTVEDKQMQFVSFDKKKTPQIMKDIRMVFLKAKNKDEREKWITWLRRSVSSPSIQREEAAK
ncbi:Sec7 domain containing protein [Histomonas meleagridis]|uniref:Sec7 domain containing protein n=1 Tax=Histomonas meleagridis TaxID=135588 RepID=UPI00355A3637|nr:Sec7 domain containing protein [Histomonas meleagridis]KAH0798331.1 Sec7 domain containing protein [Histomonas meleagridis]